MNKKILNPATCLVIIVFFFITAGKVNANEDINNSFVMPVSAGESITVYEQTGEVYDYTYSTPVLKTTSGEFSTMAGESYTITSDGNYIKIHCYRNNLLSGTAVGNNIVAVRLNGVFGYPNGIWASSIVDYNLGYNGIAESRFNALGSDLALGPYGDSYCTYLGDQDSEITLGFTVPKMTISEVQMEVNEIQMKIIELSNQLIQVLKEKIIEIQTRNMRR